MTYTVFSEVGRKDYEKNMIGLPHRVEVPRSDVDYQDKLDWPSDQTGLRKSHAGGRILEELDDLFVSWRYDCGKQDSLDLKLLSFENDLKEVMLCVCVDLGSDWWIG